MRHRQPTRFVTASRSPGDQPGAHSTSEPRGRWPVRGRKSRTYCAAMAMPIVNSMRFAEHGAAARHDARRTLPDRGPGYHVEQCDHCQPSTRFLRLCRNRHCPKCQSLARAQWIEDRQSELLDTEYFHVVFTLPEEIAAIAYQNKEVVYDILFRAASETLRTIAADPKHLGAEIGFFAVLHSLGQNLLLHPHLHCVVPGGGPHPTATAGSPAGRASSYLCACCPASSAAFPGVSAEGLQLPGIALLR